MTNVATTDDAPADVAEFDDRGLALGQSEINSVVSFDEAIERSAAAAEVEAGELVTIGSPYLSLEGMGGKDYLLAKPFHIVDVSFQRDSETDRPYVVAHLVTRENEMFYLTDGGTGIMRQLMTLVQDRRKAGHPTPFEGFTIANGLRKSEYQLVKVDGATVPKPKDWSGKIEGKATTFYLA